MSMTAYTYSVRRVTCGVTRTVSSSSLLESAERPRGRARAHAMKNAHARRAKGNPVPIPEPGSGTAYNSGPRKSVRRGNPK